MERCESLVRILSPFLDALHKMEAKLKCPVCNNFLEEPKLLPCHHIICRDCLPIVDEKKPTCPVCGKFRPKDAKDSLFVKGMIMIFNEMDGAISKIVKQIMSDESPTFEENEIQAIPPDLKEKNQWSFTSKSCIKDEANISRSSMSNGCNERQTNARGTSPNKSCDPEISPSSSSCEIIEIKTVVPGTKDSFKKEFEIKGGISGRTSSSAGTSKGSKRRREENSTSGTDKGLKRYNLSNSLIGTNQQEIKSRCTPIDLFDDECAFCHTFRTTELYGPIVSYLNGILVKPEEAGQQNIVYVHKKCLDWAPNVYYSSDNNVMKLEEEIERGEKLICSKCGVKGAVLGCEYAPCRRSYHATCALEIDCSWDSENFKMLCPAHASKKLPGFIFDVLPK